MLANHDRSGRALSQSVLRCRKALWGLALAGLLSLGLAAPALALELPQDEAGFEAYFDAHERDFLDRLGEYNDTYRLAPNATNSPSNVANLSWTFHEVRGDSLFLIIYFESSRQWWTGQAYRGLFELKESGGRLEIVSHGPVPRDGTRSGGFLGDQGRGCVYNIYATKPCVDAKRLLNAFAKVHGLQVGPDTAAILQAYKHHDKSVGDRLMARARGLPEPTSTSAFALHDEVRNMNLGGAHVGSEVGCDLDPYGPRPCPDVLKRFNSFVARHGLPNNRRIANMFKSYAQGDFQTADAIYARSKGLPVPAYAYRPSALSDEVAAAGLSDSQHAMEAEPCSYNPYAVKPCLDSTRHWREFAARYQLADTPENARIFESYAEGNDRKGDQLFASAKGVTLEQFLAAAGVPTERFVVEIYP